MSSDQAKAYHSVNFGEINTWDDWRCIPEQRPSVAPPEFVNEKESSSWINGEIDKSESITGAPMYGKATGSITFIMVNPEPEKFIQRRWAQRRSEIMNYLHNQRMTMVLDDDPDHFYEGRFTVTFTADKDYSHLIVNYTINTYREVVS